MSQRRLWALVAGAFAHEMEVPVRLILDIDIKVGVEEPSLRGCETASEVLRGKDEAVSLQALT